MSTNQSEELTIAVLIPCYNEEVTIQKVVRDFHKEIPQALIYVFDNNSTDNSSTLAQEAGAIVIRSPRQGKGNVVKHMFECINADIYLMADADDTYPASEAHKLISCLKEHNADMVVGHRLQIHKSDSFRPFHKLGNNLITWLMSTFFSVQLKDILSGYRAFSKNFVKTIPLNSQGFEIETELTLQAITKKFSMHEVAINYGSRPEGSYSKLSTWSDGFLIIKLIFIIFKDYRPLAFFGFISLLFALFSLFVGIFPIMDYIQFKYVYRVPLAILASGLGILSCLTFAIGLILDTIYKYHEETFQVLTKYKR